MNNARGSESLGSSLYQKGNYKLMVMGLIPAIILFIWSPPSAVFVLGGALITISSVLTYFYKRIGGVTGDTLGALSEITETIAFIAGGIAYRNWL
jgi:adenosylcobinamide-GDP ribazoletransferase